LGCDIHMFIEKRLRKEDDWQTDDNHVLDNDGRLTEVTTTNRDYRLFGILANVRTGGAIYPIRGIPEDLSPLILEESKGSDYHSHQWLTLYEFKKCLRAAKYDLTANKNSGAFYDWTQEPAGWEGLPESYTAVVNYCEEWIENETAEAQLLNRTDAQPEVRIIFWFDN